LTLLTSISKRFDIGTRYIWNLATPDIVGLYDIVYFDIVCLFDIAFSIFDIEMMGYDIEC
jgi:hypothetical protein